MLRHRSNRHARTRDRDEDEGTIPVEDDGAGDEGIDDTPNAEVSERNVAADRPPPGATGRRIRPDE
jgi:hypothetical protein